MLLEQQLEAMLISTNKNVSSPQTIKQLKVNTNYAQAYGLDEDDSSDNALTDPTPKTLMELKKKQKVNNDYGIFFNVTNDSEISCESVQNPE